MIDDDDEASGSEERKRYREFDCPDCSANNPMDDGFYAGDEVRCLYCGLLYKAVVGDNGKLRLKEV